MQAPSLSLSLPVKCKPPSTHTRYHWNRLPLYRVLGTSAVQFISQHRYPPFFLIFYSNGLSPAQRNQTLSRSRSSPCYGFGSSSGRFVKSVIFSFLCRSIPVAKQDDTRLGITRQDKTTDTQDSTRLDKTTLDNTTQDTGKTRENKVRPDNHLLRLYKNQWIFSLFHAQG